MPCFHEKILLATVITEALYTKLIKYWKQAAYNGRFEDFSETKSSNVAKTTGDCTFVFLLTNIAMLNKGRCLFAGCDDEPNSPQLENFTDASYRKENFDISQNTFPFT